LPEYAANMKPVIPDYDWSIFGVRVTVGEIYPKDRSDIGGSPGQDRLPGWGQSMLLEKCPSIT
ncbi:hypothetical protein ACOIQQ_002836, partial [Raoultella planticola]